MTKSPSASDPHNISRSKIALLISAALASNLMLSASVNAQQTNADEGDEENVVEVIEVAGIRSSIEGALLEKRASDVILDGISADDLGNFPDLNLGEALQRIPGVQIDRENARREATISVRGLPGSFALTTVQGLGIASAARRGRNANPFGMFDSAIFNGAYVTKSFRPDILSGGLSANVDLRINSALKRKDGQVVVRAGGGYEELTEDFVPEFFITGSKHFNDGKFGVYGTVSWEDMSFRRDIININGYRSIGRNSAGDFGLNADINYAGLEPNAEIIYPQGYRQESQISTGERVSVATGFEYIINDEMSFRVDGLYAKRDLTEAKTNFLIVDLNRSPNQIRQLGDLTSVGMANFVAEGEDDPIVLAPTYVMSNFEFEDPSVNIENRNFPTSEEVYAIYPQFNYEGENLTGRVVGTISEANNLRGQEQFRFGIRQVGNNSDLDDSNGLRGEVNTGLGNFDNFLFDLFIPDGALALAGTGNLSGNDISVNGFTGTIPRLRCQLNEAETLCLRDSNGNIIYDELNSLVANGVIVTGGNSAARREYTSIGTDWEYSFDNAGPLTAVKVGGMYIKEEGESAQTSLAAIGIPLSGYADIIDTLVVQSESITDGNGFFGGSVPGAEIDNYLSINTDALIDFIFPLDASANETDEPLVTDIPLFSDQRPFYQRGPNAINRARGGNFTSERDAVEAYVMARFSGDDYDIPIRGNFGLRYVDVDIAGRLDNPTSPTAPDATGSYSSVLPSINVIYELTEDIVMRAAYYETFETVELTEFSPSPTIIVNNPPNPDEEEEDNEFEPVGNVSVNVSNVEVEPRTSTAFDIGLAWYNRKGSMIGVNYFTKDVEADIIREIVCPLEGITIDGEITAESGQTSIGTYTSGPLLLDNTTCRIDDGFTGDEIQRNRRIRIDRNVNQDSITKVDGFEVQITQNFDFLDNFFKDFGFTINYSKINNENDEGRSLNRVSPETYNLIGYYETKNLGIRLAYNYRDEFGVEGANTAIVGERTVDARGQLDAQVNYNFENDIRLTLQLFNLTDEDPFEFDTTRLLPRRLQYDGRTVRLNVQKRF
ncbi:TonB-dependent receptor [Ningiella sp. W23]|uniref:TonB-dependent receptor n=1 Tax=Ningiella sp. W23 TaxID=3023715 RepID=UPI003757CEAB